MNYELEKRQRLFLKEKVSDIYDYNKVKSLSHLWIFVDEFAQLKMRYPQFMSQAAGNCENWKIFRNPFSSFDTKAEWNR